MRYLAREKFKSVDEENPYWISFSDLMSALLVVFILATLSLLIELTQKQQTIKDDIFELKNAERARKDILVEIKDELAKHDIEVIIDVNKTLLRIPEKTLSFDRGSYQLPKDQITQSSVIRIGEVLHLAINRELDIEEPSKIRKDYLDTIFIEGHTDSDTSQKIKGNWGLSAFRAISLWEFWKNNLKLMPAFSDMKNTYGDNLFSVSGYAATRRLNKVEDTKDDKRENRRIDIRFTVKRPSISELEDIANQ